MMTLRDLNIGLWSAAVLLALAGAGCRSEPPSATDYVARINEARATKDATFRSQAEPVPQALKATLLPLAYYAPDPSYDVPASLTLTADAVPQQMIYSDGAVREVRQVGTLGFRLRGEQHHLAAFVEVAASNPNSLFVPFGDLTNGTETYHGGRLLDVERSSTGVYDLDFNSAYNPSCYFSPTYSCPLPPKGNRLAIVVLAGEKVRNISERDSGVPSDRGTP